MIRSAFAPAKVNLFLHVGPLGADGYHPLESWMVFADVGDEVALRPAPVMAFDVQGPYAGAVPPGPDNLVIRARDAALTAADRQPAPFCLTLTKTLPPASGLGGGSSDAAATLRLLGDHLALSPELMAEIAAGLGADVPACLRAQSVMARGRGERLSPSPVTPSLDAVLVNPGVEIATRAVFAEFDARSAAGLMEAGAPDRLAGANEVAAFLRGQRNDLEAPARALHPQIGIALAVLARAPEALIARMSGSGATCFALCQNKGAAVALAARLAHDHPGWWVKACTFA